MRTKVRSLLIVLLMIWSFGIYSCASAPKATVELSEIAEQQAAELHRSHIRLVQLYYHKLRDDVNDFIDNKWTPLFLSKAVQNQQFRKDLDEAYVTSSIEPSDVEVMWKEGRPLPEPQKSAVLSGVEKAISDERSRLGGVLLDFSEETQRQINKKRRELLKSIDDQERMVINEISAAYTDLQRAQASIKAYLASVVELKEKQDLVLEKLGVLERSEEIVNSALETSEMLSVILEEKKNAEEALKAFLEEMKEAEKRTKARMPDTGSCVSPMSNQ